MMKVIKFNNFNVINEADASPVNTTTVDTSTEQMKLTTTVYNKYKNRVVAMFTNVKEGTDINKTFQDFISTLPDSEKEASDLLRTLFETEKIKYDIKNLETQKKTIQDQIDDRMKKLTDIKSEMNK